MKRYEAIIVGGGHNGLVAAAYLARAGVATLLLERRELLGGACVTEEIPGARGFRVSTGAAQIANMTPRTAADLDPAMPDTYPWLVGYYLNTPPIAGGSLDEAERFARKLAELDPQAGAEQLALVERTKHGLSDAR